MEKTPQWYPDWRAAIEFDTVEYGGIGVRLFQPDEVPRGQVGFAVTSNGESVAGGSPGDWRPEWLVIGQDTGCGDPVFASDEDPHPVFSATHGQGSWNLKLVAPSVEAFASCLRAFQSFAAGRSTPVAVEANPPTPEEQAYFLTIIRSLTNTSQDALGFWAVQIEVDLDAFDWPT